MKSNKTILSHFFQPRHTGLHLRPWVEILLVVFLAVFLCSGASAQEGTPEMDVYGNSFGIANGDNTPSTSDGTDFGTANVGGTIGGGMYMIYNTGTGTLHLTGTPKAVQISGPNAADFYFVHIYDRTLAPGASAQFELAFSPSAPGLRTATVTIPNDDPDENPYTFAIQGTGTIQEIDVQGNGVAIASGDMEPSLADGTSFPATIVNGGFVEQVFTIQNTGDGWLYLNGWPNTVEISGAHAADFSVTVEPVRMVAAGGATTFTIRFDPGATGLRQATISIANDDADENPYTFAIQGTGFEPPEIDVKGRGISIADGDDTPSLADGTDFGSKNVGATTASMFVIYNTGTGTLNLTGNPSVQISGPQAADFCLSTLYSTTIAPGGDTEFDMVFTPSAPGLRSATISIPNNDPDENPYTFAIQGIGIAAGDDVPPVITTKPVPISLWPPNHQYETITVAQCVASVSDNCATLSIDDVVISQVTSDEPEDVKGGGDGNTKKDIVIASNYRSVKLRREREGSGNGRVYTIHFAVDDGNGNIGTATYLVTVPHSHNGAPAVDDGPVYIVNGYNGGLPKLVSNGDDQPDNNFAQTSLPEGYALEQNYPNPFNPDTQIRFAIPEAGMVTLQIFNSAGHLVHTLIAGNMAAGNHQVTWNATDDHSRRVASGVYIYVLRAGLFTAQHKLVLMK